VRRAFLGSTAAGVLAQTSIPTLALPPADALRPTDLNIGSAVSATSAASPLLPLTRLLVAVDFTEPCMQAVRAAATLARRWKHAVTLLHAVPAGPGLRRWREFLETDHDRRIQRARRELELLANELSSERLAVRVVAEGVSPEDVIAHIAAEEPGTRRAGRARTRPAEPGGRVDGVPAPVHHHDPRAGAARAAVRRRAARPVRRLGHRAPPPRHAVTPEGRGGG
jgi:nucleotide-binding universal stress UspA family protein